MRELTDAELAQVYTALGPSWPPRPYMNLENLDGLYLDGCFSLDELRRLVAALTVIQEAQPSDACCPLSP